MKKRKKEKPDIFISQANIYGEKIDFFFQTISINDPDEEDDKKENALNRVLLQPGKI